MHRKAEDLINLEKKYIPRYFSKRDRAYDKLDFNLKKILENIPKEVARMPVEQFLDEFHGDLDLAN